MVRYLFYTIGDLTYQSPLVCQITFFFFRKSSLLQTVFKNTVEPHRPQITTWRTRIAWWAPKAKDTNSEYVILISCPLQQWFQERTSRLRCTYIARLVIFSPAPNIWGCLHVCRVDTDSRILDLENNMGWMVCFYVPATLNIDDTYKFHFFTVHSNSLNFTHQLMHFYI